MTREADPAARWAPCCYCGKKGRVTVIYTAPSGWKRIVNSFGQAAYICDDCRNA